MARPHVHLLLMALLILLCARAGFAQRTETLSWKVGSDTRRAIVYAPSAAVPVSGAPLVFAFHGHGDDMQNFQHVDLHRAWPEAIVVYVQGLPSRRDGLAGWQVEKGSDGDRDLALVDVALASLRERFRVDAARVYATGFSNGANFTYLLWAERPSVFAAFAPVAARLAASVRPAQPRPVFHVAGREDRQIRFVDQQAAMDAARRVNAATGDGVSCGSGCLQYASATPVMTWIHPGGHEYPGDTSDRIAAFFRAHPRMP